MIFSNHQVYFHLVFLFHLYFQTYEGSEGGARPSQGSRQQPSCSGAVRRQRTRREDPLDEMHFYPTVEEQMVDDPEPSTSSGFRKERRRKREDDAGDIRRAQLESNVRKFTILK